ncbi:MAG: hypothetical protein HY353_00295 [Candidatus Omnitrophica bacterium]|nr:hypothetical protein [Candidatus Omnitrophota bacterium]
MADMRCVNRNAATLVELVIVIVVSAILFLVTPILVFHGVKTLVFLPKALAANDAATEVLHQVIEGGFSTLTGQPTVRGLRFAVRRSATEPALWLAEASRIGFRTADGQSILLRWDDLVASQEVIRRSLPTPSCTPTIGTEEVLPYHAQGIVRILPTVRLFRYYNQSGVEVNNPPTCPPPATIRRVDIAFTAQTGNGVFDEGDAREDITSSVAIRVP